MIIPCGLQEYACRVVLQPSSLTLRIVNATWACWLPTLCLLVAALVVVPVAGARSAATFVSHRYKYSVVLPGAASAWDAEPATFTLPASAQEGTIHSPFTDVFIESKTERLYILASLPNQANVQKWAKFVIS